MSKKPTPKRRLAKARGRRRYAAFQYKARKRLSNKAHLLKCSNCHELRITHHVCPNCGYYRGRQVIDMSSDIKDKIETIKA